MDMFFENEDDAGNPPTPTPARGVTIELRDAGDNTYHPHLDGRPLCPVSLRPMTDSALALQALSAPTNAVLSFLDENGTRIGRHTLSHLVSTKMLSLRTNGTSGPRKRIDRRPLPPVEPVEPQKTDRRERNRLLRAERPRFREVEFA
jgi:hypothetical protein